MHIALKNGSNIALLNAMGHVIIEEKPVRQSFRRFPYRRL
ncbi:hypothetical protein HTY54_08140 [Escherichia coli]|nr:hypothetical protein [Escherichia coli]